MAHPNVPNNENSGRNNDSAPVEGTPPFPDGGGGVTPGATTCTTFWQAPLPPA
jgi:hypothetical protein